MKSNWPVLVSLCTLALLACAPSRNLPSSASTTAREIEAAEQAAATPLVQPRGLGEPERLPVILGYQVHMQSTEGKPVILEPGNYLIEVSPTPPLKLIREWDNQSLMLSAQVGAHHETLAAPKAVSIIGPGEDERHVVLLLPDGKTVDASGSHGGVTTRAANMASPGAISQAPSNIVTVPLSNLKVRPLPQKPARSVYYKGLLRNRVVVKFKEGAAVRVAQPLQRSAKPSLALVPSLMDAESQKRMQHLNLTDAVVQTDLGKVNQILARPTVQAVAPLFSRPDQFLRSERAEAERQTGIELADLGNYFRLSLEPTAKGEDIVDELNALPSVEIAYLAPIPVNALADIPPTTMNYQPNQGYLIDIDAPYVWPYFGGKGQGVRVIDIEQAWRLSHEDLPPPFYNDPNPAVAQDHGTAVFGVMGAGGNGYGVTGIARNAQFGFVSTYRPDGESNTADAIIVAMSKLRRFDVILIEAQVSGPPSGQPCPSSCNCDQFELVPVEYNQAEFDAIRFATAFNLNVVEAAANGGMNLDDPRYGQRFNRTFRDSGAILVGARAQAGQFPTCFSNSGSRLDVAAWGERVWTTGYGTIRVAGAEGDAGQWYHHDFGGTSSASAIVTGAVACLLGIQQHITHAAAQAGVHKMNPAELRTLLRETGRPQVYLLDRPIGPTVNLRNAFALWSRGMPFPAIPLENLPPPVEAPLESAPKSPPTQTPPIPQPGR